jgi:hypothetical protein
LFKPYQLPTHGHPCGCAPSLSDPHSWYGHPIWERLKMQQDKPADFTCANLDGLFGILHTQKILVHAARSGFRASFLWSSGVIWRWSRLVRSVLARSRSEVNVGYPTAASGGGHCIISRSSTNKQSSCFLDLEEFRLTPIS